MDVVLTHIDKAFARSSASTALCGVIRVVGPNPQTTAGIDVSRKTCKRMPLTTGLNHGADRSIFSAAIVAKTWAATE